MVSLGLKGKATKTRSKGKREMVLVTFWPDFHLATKPCARMHDTHTTRNDTIFRFDPTPPIYGLGSFICASVIDEVFRKHFELARSSHAHPSSYLRYQSFQKHAQAVISSAEAMSSNISVFLVDFTRGIFSGGFRPPDPPIPVGLRLRQ